MKALANAGMVELVDTIVLEAMAARRASSTLATCTKLKVMIDKEKYNERLDEIIKDLKGLKITDENSSMCEIDRVTCLGGVALQVEDAAEDAEYAASNPALGGKSKRELEKG